MSSSVRLQPQWTEKHRDYMRRAVQATISVAEGAVRAGKTVDNVAAFARMLELGVPDRIHLATGATSAAAKLNIGDCNGFGLEYIFRGRCSWTKYKGNEALRIKAHGRDYVVIFAGGGKADSFKKIRGNSYGMWIATEINIHHVDTIKEAFNRQLAAKVRKVFWDLNPSSPAGWIYRDYIDRFDDAFGEKYNYQHFTIRDNATITAERLAEIEAQYDTNSIWYKRDILGERCNVEGLVYDMFDKEIHVVDEAPPTDGEYYVSSDFGVLNAQTFLLWRKEWNSDRWVCLREFYYSGRESKRNKTTSELVDDLDMMLNGIEVERVIIDPSAAAMIAELRKHGYAVRHANNDVLNGISEVAMMLKKQKLVFCECCERTIEEFNLYRWDEKASENGIDAVIKTDDHCMDAVRYFVKTMGLAKRVDEPTYQSLLWR